MYLQLAQQLVQFLTAPETKDLLSNAREIAQELVEKLNGHWNKKLIKYSPRSSYDFSVSPTSSTDSN